MTREEFMQYAAAHVKDYLPQEYENAQVSLQDVVKNNNRHLTGMTIQKEGETVVPCVYLDEDYERYAQGEEADKLIKEIADNYQELGRFDQENSLGFRSVSELVRKYENIRPRLETHICDRNENEERLKELVYTEHGDFAATYHVVLQDVLVQGKGNGVVSTAVTPQMLDLWGVDIGQLHKDALNNDLKRGVCFTDIESVLENIVFDEETENLFTTGDRAGNMSAEAAGKDRNKMLETPLYCLTTEDYRNGASLILQEGVLEKVGEIVGDDYYILPSSVHETLIIPEYSMMTREEIAKMVKDVNEAVVNPEEKLSDHVQYYDRKTGVMENALKREERIHQERMMENPIKEILRQSAQRSPRRPGNKGREL